ncbi:hypothetical protein LC607_11525 [Nostoc sp. CHAB 5824]|nr:hypothetical protein [Nostoc sp. CHAB 5824]
MNCSTSLIAFVKAIASQHLNLKPESLSVPKMTNADTMRLSQEHLQIIRTHAES